MKKIISSITVVALLLSVFSVIGVSAESNAIPKLTMEQIGNEITNGDYIYQPISKNEANIVEYIGSGEKIIIPPEIEGYKIAGIDDGAFICCDTITEVIIPEGVKTIGKYAFRACNNLSAVSFPSTLISIGRAAFRADSLTNIEIPDSVQKIERGAFANNKNLADVTIGAGIKNIENAAFNKSDILTIIGYVNTVAYDFAYSNGIKFQSLGNAPEPAIKKANTVKVTVKTKTVKLKKLNKKAQKVKAITVKKAQGKVSYKLIKSGVSKKIRKLVSINKKGVITIKKWKKAKIGTYKIKVRITAKGNSKYKPRTLIKTAKITIT